MAAPAWWQALTLAWPLWLLAWPVPWLLRALWRPAHSDAAALVVPYGGMPAHAAQGPARRWRGSGAGLLAWLAWTLLCVAAARPQSLGAPVLPPQQGRDLLLALDLSDSMNEVDMVLGGRPVDRLTAAKAVIADFLDRRQGDRVGLVVFGRRAYVLVPQTADLTTVREQLADSVPGLAGSETAIGDAIGLATKRLATQASGPRVVVLLTDGVNTAGVLDPVAAARLARDAKVRVHAIAFGGEGGLSVFGLRLRLPGAQDSIDEEALKAVASTTGGRFFRARDTEALAGIYAELDAIEPVARPGRAVRPVNERYPWPLAGALLIGVLAAWRRRA